MKEGMDFVFHNPFVRRAVDLVIKYEYGLYFHIIKQYIRLICK